MNVEIKIKANGKLPDLTVDELRFITYQQKCPDCKVGRLYVGPRGGQNMNMECANWKCGHKFNVVPFASGIYFAERL